MNFMTGIQYIFAILFAKKREQIDGQSSCVKEVFFLIIFTFHFFFSLVSRTGSLFLLIFQGTWSTALEREAQGRAQSTKWKINKSPVQKATFPFKLF